MALAETNVGHLVVPCSRNAGQAMAVVAHWRALAEAGLTVDALHTVVGGAVVDPAGNVVESWGSVPVPGGRSRWSPLSRLRDWAACLACGVDRWPGCWVDAALEGCGVCLPGADDADPRPWPNDPPEPRVPREVKEPRPMAVPAAMKPKRPARPRSWSTPTRIRDVV